MSDTNSTENNAYAALHIIAQPQIKRLVELRADLIIHDRNKPEQRSAEWKDWNGRLSSLRREYGIASGELKKSIEGSGLPCLTRIRLAKHVDAEITQESNRRSSSPIATQIAEEAVMTFYEKQQESQRIAQEKQTRAEALKTQREKSSDPYAGIDLGI
jgi:hypothetical protein